MLDESSISFLIYLIWSRFWFHHTWKIWNMVAFSYDLSVQQHLTVVHAIKVRGNRLSGSNCHFVSSRGSSSDKSFLLALLWNFLGIPASSSSISQSRSSKENWQKRNQNQILLQGMHASELQLFDEKGDKESQMIR